jgi:hypothetical protein
MVFAGIGGPDAVRQFLGELPDGFPQPVLVQQRLDGGRHDRLVQQMARVTDVAGATGGGRVDGGARACLHPAHRTGRGGRRRPTAVRGRRRRRQHRGPARRGQHGTRCSAAPTPRSSRPRCGNPDAAPGWPASRRKAATTPKGRARSRPAAPRPDNRPISRAASRRAGRLERGTAWASAIANVPTRTRSAEHGRHRRREAGPAGFHREPGRAVRRHGRCRRGRVRRGAAWRRAGRNGRRGPCRRGRPGAQRRHPRGPDPGRRRAPAAAQCHDRRSAFVSPIPEPVAGTPDWLLGRIRWRGWQLPLVAFSRLTGIAERAGRPRQQGAGGQGLRRQPEAALFRAC